MHGADNQRWVYIGFGDPVQGYHFKSFSAPETKSGTFSPDSPHRASPDRAGDEGRELSLTGTGDIHTAPFPAHGAFRSKPENISEQLEYDL